MNTTTEKSTYSIKKLDELWDVLGDIPIDDDDSILEPFLDWEAGTYRFHIWQWFDARYPFGLAAKQGLYKPEDNPFMSVAHQFQREMEDFIESPERNRHIDVEFLQTYVRKSFRPCSVGEKFLLKTGLDLATMSLPEAYQKKGVMRGILQIMENVALINGYAFVYVENILIPEVAASLVRYPGWEGRDINSFIKRIL